jgi:serine/threonine-protein kinase
VDFKPLKIGKYRLLKKLATGGMAEVFRGESQGAEGFVKQLALKRILPNYASNDEFRKMFQYEARLSATLQHANIVQVYAFEKATDTYLLVMEYVDGKNLRQFVNKARKLKYFPPIEFGAWVVNEVCKGLEYAHEKRNDQGVPLNIIHRDMSPQNVMISYDGAVKIVDFGIAKAKDKADETRSGVIKGKFGYMSPEQALGIAIDHRSDIFSTGIILWELVTGKRLFAAENDMATLRQIQECLVESPSRLNPRVSKELERIVMKALTKDLSLRYQSAGQFHRQLQEYLNKFHPTFTQRDFVNIVRQIFADDMVAEKREFEQLSRQPIPYSQSQPLDDDRGEESGSYPDDEPVTASDDDLGRKTQETMISEVVDVADLGFDDLDGEPGGNTVAEGPGPEDSGVRPEPRATTLPGTPEEENPTTPSARELEPGLILSSSAKLKRHDAPSGPSSSHSIPTESPRTQPSGPKTVGGGLSRSNPDIVPAGMSTGARLPNAPSQVGSLPGQSTVNAASGMKVTLDTPGAARVSTGVRATAFPRTREETSTGMQAAPDADERAETVISTTPALSRTGAAKSRRFEPSRMSDPIPMGGERRLPPALTLLLTIALLAFATFQFLRPDQGGPGGDGPVAGGPPSDGGGARNGGGGFERPPELVPDNGRNVGNIPSLDPGTENPPTVQPRSGVRAGTGECFAVVNSDPGGASVVVDGKTVGTTPATYDGRCETSVTIRCELDGYTDSGVNIYLKKGRNNHLCKMREVPRGVLQVVVNVNSDVFVDNERVARATANQPLELPLVAGRKYTLRFVNTVLGIDESREFSVERGKTRSERLSFSVDR